MANQKGGKLSGAVSVYKLFYNTNKYKKVGKTISNVAYIRTVQCISRYFYWNWIKDLNSKKMYLIFDGV